ncbi:MAG: hypothetical protein WCX65_06200 [bacterium]
MNRIYLTLRVTLICFLICFLFAHTAHAYIDIGAGSYFFQIAVASMLGIMVSVKIYWKIIKKKIVSLFSGKKPLPKE